MTRIFHPFLSTLLLFWLTGPVSVLGAQTDDQILVSMHVHSEFSTGFRTFQQIAGYAKKNDIDAVLMTDHLYEHYEYGLAPFRNWLKVSIERNSILKTGVSKYFGEVAKIDQRYPGVSFIAGTTATPFYYWSGSLIPGPLVLNDRAKDLLVFGLPKPSDYEALPVIGRPASHYDAYSGMQGSKPYQEFIDIAVQKGGLVYWSHPRAQEHALFQDSFLKFSVYLDSASYEKDLLRTRGYTGFGIDIIELRYLDKAEHSEAIKVGGLRDQLLQQYTRGKRERPVWVIGETDFTGEEGKMSYLYGLLNVLLTSDKSEDSILKTLREGRAYVTLSDKREARRLILRDFSLLNPLTGARAGIGEELEVSEDLVLNIDVAFSDGSKEALTFWLIQNGTGVKEWHSPLPVREQIPLETSKRPLSSIRLLAFSGAGDRLLTNPVFIRKRPESA